MNFGRWRQKPRMRKEPLAALGGKCIEMMRTLGISSWFAEEKAGELVELIVGDLFARMEPFAQCVEVASFNLPKFLFD